jgi:flagellar hook assembly protein FlgD
VTFAVLCATLTALCAFASGPIIVGVLLDREGIFPNGDGVADSVIMTYTLAETAAVHVLVLERDSATVVDSLVAAAAQPPTVVHKATWHGTYLNGSPVPDDNYVLAVRAAGANTSDSAFGVVSVDRVRPQLVVTQRPNPFAPGAPRAPSNRLTIEYDVFDPYPSTEVDVRVEIYRPTTGGGEQRIVTLADTTITPGDPQEETWNGANVSTEGTYTVGIVATDVASNRSEVRSPFEIDLLPPEIETTSLQSDMSLRVIPDSLFGWAFDRISPVDSVQVRYSGVGGKAAFKPVPSTQVRNDTTFFAVQLTDSIVEQKPYSLGFRAVDPWGRETIALFTIEWDTLPPAAPVLTQPPSPTRDPAFVLDGTVDSDTDVMRIYRNEALLDTIFPNAPVTPRQFPYRMTLVPGENRIYAVAVDLALNESVSSNEVTVTLDSSPGLLISQPFRPNDTFIVNLAETASSVTLRIYDLSGKLVKTLNATSPGTNLFIDWNGKNGDNEPVKKGPLAAVAQIQYQNGGSEVFREIFLLDR